MSRVCLIKGCLDINEEIIRFFDLNQTDFSDHLVIFPGKRPPHFLKKVMAAKIGKPFNPPRTFSMNVFIGEVYRNILGQTHKWLNPCDAVAIIYNLYRENPVKLSEGSFDTFDRFLPIAFKLFAALEELRIEKIHYDASVSALSQEPRILMSLYKPFYDYLDAHHYCTRATQYADVSDKAGETDWSVYSTISLAGFFTFTRSEKDLATELLKRPETVLYFQDGPGIENILHSLNVQPEIIEGKLNPPQIQVFQTADAHEEIFRLNALLKDVPSSELLGDRNVIVLPDRNNLFPLLRHTLCRYDENEYNISMGYPVTRTPLYGFLNILLDAVNRRWQERFGAADYLRFLLHPYIKNTLFGHRTDITRILCHTIEEVFFADRSSRWFTPEDLEQDDNLFSETLKRLKPIDDTITARELRDLLKTIHEQTIIPFLDIRSISDFAEKCISVTEFLNHKTTAPKHPYFSSFAGPVIDSLENLKEGLIGKERFSNLPAYQRFLNYYLQTEEVAFTGTPLKGLQVLGFLETRNIRFDRVYLLDVNEGILPSSGEADIFLPPGIRKVLQLSVQEQRDSAAKYYYSLLIQNARQVNLFYVNNDEMHRSRFIEEYLWLKQKETGNLESEEQRIEKISGTFALDQSLPAPVMKSDAVLSALKNLDYSATGLRHYLSCGLKFYYQYVLRLYEKESVDEDIDGADTGNFIHQILERYFAGKLNQPLIPELLTLDVLDECINTIFTKRYGNLISGELQLIKQQVQSQLRDYIIHYQIKMLRDNSITITELEYPIKIHSGGFHLKGKIDRIEKRNDRIILIDYKKSGNKKDIAKALERFDPSDKRTWAEPLQLAFYRLIYAEHTKLAPHIVQPALLLIGCRSLDTNIEIQLAGHSQNPEEQADVFRTMIFNIIHEINDPSLSFNLPEKPGDHCPDCEFNRICGTQWMKKGY